jgi:hypothetical protein
MRALVERWNSRPAGQAVASAVIATCLLLAGALHASDACDRLLRQWIDEGKAAGLSAAQYNSPFERLAQLERTYGDATVASVDMVFKAADVGRAPKLMDQFLARLTPDEARKLFEVGASLSEDGRKGLAKAASFAAQNGVEPGKSAHRLLNANFITDAAKDATFRDVKEIAESGVPGLDGLFKKAGEQATGANLGGIYEIQSSAMIKRNGSYGQLQGVLVDEGGPGALDAIDTLTTTHAFQMKSKVNPSDVIRFGEGLDVTPDQLTGLVDQAGGRTPVLVVSNPVSPELTSECVSRGITILTFVPVR